jgi:hypothetical protein
MGYEADQAAMLCSMDARLRRLEFGLNAMHSIIPVKKRAGMICLQRFPCFQKAKSFADY